MQSMIMRDDVIIGMVNSSLGLFRIYIPIYAIYLFLRMRLMNRRFVGQMMLLLFFFFFPSALLIFLLLIPPLSRMTFPWIVRECLMRKFSVLGYLPFEDSLLMVIVPLVGDQWLCFLKR
jgi:hypothetical protein